MATLLKRRLKPTYISNELSRLATVLRHLIPLTIADERLLEVAHAQIARLKPAYAARQAVPARAWHLRFLESKAPRKRILLFIKLLWAAAARPSDVGRLRARDVTFPRYCGVQVVYRLTKSQQTGSVRKCVFFLPSRPWRRLRRLVHQTDDNATFLPYTADDVNRFMRPYLPHLSSYSFRRGAVQLLLDRDIRPREICRLTGHQSTRTLLVYADRVPPRAWQQMARGAQALWDPSA